ncbi:MAG TPA: hypothetical protein VNY73_01985 [Bacteroidia bacterium]|jgi:hypothetical protein|nr:hypothetical protein [Bacteroidia bacterium]
MENTELIPGQKPQALKTLCILSFIGCGLIFLLSLLSIPNILKSDEQKRTEIEQIRGYSEEMADQLEIQYMDPSYTKNMIIKLVVDLLFLGITLVGVAMMWNLKKKGFYIYAASEILYYFSGFLSGHGDPSKMMNTLPATMKNIAFGVFALVIIQDLIFIFLYWRQTKHMK